MVDLKQWPKMELAVNKNILPVRPKTKYGTIKANNSLMTVGLVMPAYGGKHGLAVFTEDFLTAFEKTSLLNRGVFFFIFCHSGLLASRYGKMRWLFAGGLASGEIKDDLYYFNKLSSCMHFPDRAVTDEDLKNLENDMWQVKI